MHPNSRAISLALPGARDNPSEQHLVLSQQSPTTLDNPPFDPQHPQASCHTLPLPPGPRAVELAIVLAPLQTPRTFQRQSDVLLQVDYLRHYRPLVVLASFVPEFVTHMYAANPPSPSPTTSVGQTHAAPRTVAQWKQEIIHPFHSAGFHWRDHPVHLIPDRRHLTPLHVPSHHPHQPLLRGSLQAVH